MFIYIPCLATTGTLSALREEEIMLIDLFAAATQSVHLCRLKIAASILIAQVRKCTG